jgi:5-methylcytosine-specific restriction endonuclease McrA
MTKRQIVYNKFNGRCAYCGCELKAGFHIDHIEPIRRNSDGSCINPQNELLENMNPSCPSCNIMKHSMTLEQFRDSIKNFVTNLNKYNNQYKFAKKYGLVSENDIEVKFYFETLND